MFNNISYTYDERKSVYTFSVWLGYRFKHFVGRIGYPTSKQKYLFNNLTLSELTIHRFFIPDLQAILKQFIELGSVSGVNMVSVSKLLSILEDDIIATSTNKIGLDYAAIDRDFKYQPLEAQKPAYEGYRTIRGMNNSRGMLLDGAVGVGKTYISLSLATALHNEVTLIVAPLPTIQRVWVSSLAGEGCLYKTPQNYHLIGESSEYKGEKFIIVHYENIKKVIPLYKKYNLNINTLIVDEVHNFNDIKSNRTKELIDLVDTIPFTNTIPMSGTPIKAKATDLLPLFKIINKDFDKHLEKRFLGVYRSPSMLRGEVLKEKYLNHTVVLKKSSMDVPPLSTPTIRVKLDNSNHYTIASILTRMRAYSDKRTLELERDYDVYKDIYIKHYTYAKKSILAKNLLTENDFRYYENNIVTVIDANDNNRLMAVNKEIASVNEFERKYIEPELKGVDKTAFRNAKSVYKYIMLKVQGEVLANIVMRARIDCYSELANTVNILGLTNSTIKKTIIFSNYTEVCDAAKESCLRSKLEPITVYGDTSKYLTRNVSIFTNNKKSNPLISTYKSLSTGVPLIIANVIIILGLPHRQYVFEQAVGRAWRTGQDLPVSAYIIELDTGDVPNITGRDFDIIEFFRNEVSRLTGKDDSVIIGANSATNIELGVNGILEPNELYINKIARSTIDIIKEWF